MMDGKFNSQNPPDWSKLSFKALFREVQQGAQLAQVRLAKILQAPASFENTILGIESLDQEHAVAYGFLNELAGLHKPLAQQTSIDRMLNEAAKISLNLSDSITYNQDLFKKVKAVYRRRQKLSALDAKLTKEIYQSFLENGVHLAKPQQQELSRINQRLEKVTLQFDSRIQRAVNRLRLRVKDVSWVRGLDKEVVAAARRRAHNRGYLFEIDETFYSHVMEFAEHPRLRQEVFTRYRGICRRGRENTLPLIQETLTLRHQRAKLIGRRSVVDTILRERMVKNRSTLDGFFKKLRQRALPAATKDLAVLAKLAKQSGESLTRADVNFYERKAKEAALQLDFQELRQYFPLDKVWAGLQTIVSNWYGLRFKKLPSAPVYHSSVEVYAVEDETGRERSLLYLDLFARREKQSGAWVNGITTTKPDQVGVVVLAADFLPPTPGTPTLLSFTDVRTLFHEFGHALHEICSEVPYDAFAGTNVAWDFVEVPSQALENMVFTKEVLTTISGHYQTGAALSDATIDKLIRSNQLFTGLNLAYFLGLAALDLWVHTQPVKKITTSSTEKFLRPYMFPAWPEGTGRFHTFDHIISGGYEVGYYSYLWAEVLDADVVEAFQTAADPSRVAKRFQQEILSRGSSRSELDSFKAFRGRRPSLAAFWRRQGLKSR